MIKIITDSTSYFKQSEAEEYGIKVLPITYKSGNYIYLESYSGTDKDIENLLKSGYGYSTSHPDESVFSKAFQKELMQGNQILCIPISSRLSLAYKAAMDAAIKLDNSNIAVFDSLQTAGGLNLLVKYAKILANNGSSLSEVYMALPKINNKISTFFSVNDMLSLRKSGRIGIVRMNVSTIMNLRPILALKDGTIVSEEIARGTMDVIRKLSDKMPLNTKEAVINYIENSDTAIGVYNALKTKAPYLPIHLRKAGPVLAIHVGLGFVSVSYITE